MPRPSWKKSWGRRFLNRILHLIARLGPGGHSLRPFLHRMRGVKLSERVWIGDDVYLENEYPETVEIHEDVTISIRSMIIGHTNGRGRIVIEKEVFIGPGAIIVCSEGKLIRIGHGAVLGPGCVITSSVAAQTFVLHSKSSPVGRALVPLTTAPSMEAFMAGLQPLARSPQKAVVSDEAPS